MKATTITAVVLYSTTAAFAQLPAEKPVNENYTYNTAPRFQPYKVRRTDFVYEPSYKNIKPPLADVKVSSINKTIDNKEGAKLTYPSGTSITIPPDAFVYEDGKPVRGNVTISYREFKNPLDFLLSGIPMGADSAGVKGQFISAGMFEMNASASNKQVFLKKGSKIDVQMSSMDAKPDYNLYAFNDATGSWETKADKSAINVSASAPTTSAAFYSAAVSKYMSVLRGPGYLYDSTSCKERFESMDYFYTSRNRAKSLGENRWDWNGQSFRTLVKVSNTHKCKNGDIIFRIARTAGANRELIPYQYVYWKLKDPMDYKSFKQATGYKNYFFDVRIEENAGTYSIRLKGPEGFKTINAVPVKVGKNYTTAEYTDRAMNKLFVRYNKMMKWREKYFDRQIAKGKIMSNFLVVKPGELASLAWNVSKASMNEEEKEMGFSEWTKYAEESAEAQEASLRTGYTTASNITRTFSIDGMGVWNCDQIKRLSRPVQVIASYTDEEGKPLNATATFILDKKLNGILQYYGTNEISFSKTAETVLIAINANGDIAVVPSGYFKDKKFPDKKPHTFPVKMLGPGSAASVLELKKVIGI